MRRKKPKPFDPQLVQALNKLAPEQLRAAHKIAKDPQRGLTPFFTNAYAMIALRNAAYK